MTKYAAFEAAASTLEGIRDFPADSILICCLPLADRLLLTRETPCFEFRFNGTKTRLGGVFLHQNGETYTRHRVQHRCPLNLGINWLYLMLKDVEEKL